MQVIKNNPPKTEIKFSITLSDEQKKAKAEILLHPVSFVLGKPGSGKAQDINSLVITPNGVKKIGDIVPGDYVISENGEPIKVLEIFPQGKKDIYQLTFSDGFTANCCEDHLWNVIGRNDMYNALRRNGAINKNYKQYRTLSLKQILEKGLKTGKRDKWFIPEHGVTKFNKQNIKIDPYILGCLLGVGSLTELTPMLTSDDQEIIDYFQNWCDNNNLLLYQYITKSKYGKLSSYSITSKKNQEMTEYNTLTKYLREYNLMGCNSFSKHIPKEYLYNSEEIRLELLQGLMDTDGWIQINKFRTKKGHSACPYYCTVSKQLKDDFVFLIQSLGGVCYVRECQGKYKAKGEKEYKFTAINYRITINFPNHLRNKLFKSTRKKERITEQKNILNRSISDIKLLKNDNAVCILVDSPTHLYLTDNFIVTHNTLLAVNIALDQLFKKQVERIIITRPTVSTEDNGFLPGTEAEKMEPWLVPIRSNMLKIYNKENILKKLEQDKKIEIVSLTHFRGRSFENAVCIIDEFQNLTKQQLAMAIGRLGKNSIMIFCGDPYQCDLKYKNDSAYHEISKIKHSKYVYSIELLNNHRHEALDEILKLLSTT